MTLRVFPVSKTGRRARHGDRRGEFHEPAILTSQAAATIFAGEGFGKKNTTEMTATEAPFLDADVTPCAMTYCEN